MTTITTKRFAKVSYLITALVIFTSAFFVAQGSQAQTSLDIRVNDNVTRGDQASIYWNTDREANCGIDYNDGPDITQGIGTNGSIIQYGTSTNDGRFHYVVNLTGLDSNKEYYYQVICNNLNNDNTLYQSELKKLLDGRSDLSISDFFVSPKNPKVGEAVIMNANIKNLGGVLISGQGITNGFRSFQDMDLSNHPLPYIPNGEPSPANPFDAGETLQMRVVDGAKFFSAGRKSIYFKVDNANELDEKNENNNTWQGEVIVGTADGLFEGDGIYELNVGERVKLNNGMTVKIKSIDQDSIGYRFKFDIYDASGKLVKTTEPSTASPQPYIYDEVGVSASVSGLGNNGLGVVAEVKLESIQVMQGGQSDFVVEDIWFQKAQSSHSGSGVVQFDSLGAKLCNRGDAKASLRPAVFTEFEIGGVKLHNSMGSDLPLEVNQCIYPVVPVNNEPEIEMNRTYSVTVRVDHDTVNSVNDDLVDESNENNNSLTKTVTVAGSEFSKADFTNIKVSDITSNSALISWTTNQSITSNLQWGLGSDANNLNFTNSLDLDRNVLKTSHKVVLNNLQPNRRYYYLIEGQDTNGYGRGGPGVRSFETTNTSTGTITGGGHTVNGRIAKIQWRTDGRYNCSIVFKGRSDIGDDLLYPGAGISISYAGQDTSVQVDLGQLNLPNRESDRIVYYKIVCRDRNDGHKGTESSVNKIELSAPVPTQASVSTTGAPVQNDPEFSSNTEVLALRERIKRLELRITELEREVVARERQLTTRINARLTQQVKGEILLQVEGKGEAWYVDLITGQRFYLQNGQSAYQALQAFGLGITNADLAKIPVGLEERAERVDSDGDGLDDRLEEALGTDPTKADSDGDGFSDGEEVKHAYNPRGTSRLAFNQSLANTLKGRFVLQVQDSGQAWYINPKDGKRYYMKDGKLAYQIMRYLSLGITNEDIRQIAVGELE